MFQRNRCRPGEGVSKESPPGERGCFKETAAGPERVSQRMPPAGERVAHSAAVAKSNTAVGGGEIKRLTDRVKEKTTQSANVRRVGSRRGREAIKTHKAWETNRR